MRLSLKTSGGLDLGTGALILVGLALIVVSFVAAGSLGVAATLVQPSPPPVEVVLAPAARTMAADQVSTVLTVDASTGAGSRARSGDRVDVLGYFSREIIGPQSLTRTLLPDVAVLAADRSGPNIALTLAVSHDAALLLQEALAIGARPFVTLRSPHTAPDAEAVPPSFSDTDLAQRLAGLR